MAPPTALALLRAALVCVTLGLAASASAQFVPERYLPLAPGNEWDYLVNRSRMGTIVVLPTMELVNGVPTWVSEGMGEGLADSRENLSNDALGLRLHRLSADVGAVSASLTYAPPLVLSPAVAPLGTSVRSSGTLTVSIPRVGSFPLRYDATSSVLRAESVDVPAGRFDTIRVRLLLSVSGTIAGQPISISSTDENWFGEDVGLVRSVETAEGESLTLELVDVRVPEPSLALLQPAALLAALGLGRRRARSRAGRVLPSRSRRIAGGGP